MQSIYEYSSYRKWLKDQASDWKKRSPANTLARLSSLAELQAPYLTNVLKERAHLNADQFFSVAQVFAINPTEMQYGQTLLEIERSSVEKRKEVLRQKLSELKRQRTKTENYLSSAEDVEEKAAAQFYLQPNLQLVHSLLGIEKYSQNHDLIGRKLNLDPIQLNTIIQTLLKIGFIKKTDDGYQKTRKSIHLNKSSPICRPQQILMQNRSLSHQQGLPEDQRYNFAVTFTADEETREKIQTEFMKFLTSIEKLVQKAPSEEAYQINFDLFRW